VALIARGGPDWWRSVGTVADPGSALITVSGGVARPGVYEIPLGVSLEAVLGAVGAPAPSTGAVLIGGYFGTWIASDRIGQVSLGAASLQMEGSSFGCGAIAVLPNGTCGLAESARVARWLADQNAGQCGPCTFGLPAIADAMDAVVAGERSGKADQLVARWTAMVKGRGACKHPDGAARFVESSMRTFSGEVVKHRRRGPCPPARPVLPVPVKGSWR
jgi:NADH:ubiquinone oxidoreductase subunit F (NADH-binding)